MRQELINLIHEIRVLANQSEQFYTRDIAGHYMTPDLWDQLQDNLKQLNLKSQEAFFMAATLRRIGEQEFKND